MSDDSEQPNAVRIEATDNVVTLLREVAAGSRVSWGDGAVAAQQDTPVAHKLACVAIAEGAPVVKYGQPIGTAARQIAPGEHVHSHNLSAEAQEL